MVVVAVEQHSSKSSIGRCNFLPNKKCKQKSFSSAVVVEEGNRKQQEATPTGGITFIVPPPPSPPFETAELLGFLFFGLLCSA